MSKVTIWKSDLDGKLFEDKTNYVKHLRKLAGARMIEKSQAKMNAEREEMITKMGQVASVQELEQFIKDNWSWFYNNGLKGNLWRVENKELNTDHELVDIKITDVKWNKHVSNSHSCPRKRGVTNFGDHDGRPTGYPGWYARIRFTVKTSEYTYKRKKHFYQGFGSDYFNGTIINTGSGGGGDCQYQYGITLWAADFPVMYEKQMRWEWCEKENRERRLVWRSLGGKEAPPEVYEVPEDWVLPDPYNLLEQ